jgi:arylsulfatase A-like enzyme
MKHHKDKPFFLTLSYNSVHHLIHQTPKKYLDKYGVEEIPAYDPKTMGNYGKYYNRYSKLDPISDKDMRQYFLANLNCLDDNIGRLLDAMDKMRVADNTLVIFFSDNGGSPLTGANNRPLRGSKYVMYEGGIRVPFVVKWPGQLPAGKRYDHRISALDILPSCLEVAQVKPQHAEEFDGASFIKAVKNNISSPSSQSPMFWKFSQHYAVREGDWKLCKTGDYTKRTPTSQILQGPGSNGNVQLFNLKDDPSEQNDIAKKHPDIVKKMSSLYTQWTAQCRKHTK